MENCNLTLAIHRRDDWLSKKGNYAFGLGRLNTLLCLYKLDDEKIPFDSEAVNVEDPDDHARAIHALLDRNL
jgi:hypothetical protein